MRAVEVAAPLRFGTLIHSGLEQWWRAPKGMRLTYALASMPLELDAYELARATEMLRGYDARWGDEPLEPLGVELEFRAPLLNPATGEAAKLFELGGKMDVLVINTRDGLVYIVEHKTSSEDLSEGSDYWQALRIDSQISTYYSGARALGHAPAGVIYDVLRKPALRPFKATPEADRKYTRTGKLYRQQHAEDEEPAVYQVRVRDAIAASPDTYLRRALVVRLEDEELEAAWDTWQTARSIRDDGLAQRWPRNPEACRRFNRLCPYFGVCTKTESLDDPRVFRHVDNVHTELSADTQPMTTTTH